MRQACDVKYAVSILDIGVPGKGKIPANFADIPELRCNNEDSDMVLKMVAASCDVDKLITNHYKRLKLVPNGWRDAHLVRTLLIKLYSGLARTLPEKKRLTVMEMAPHIRYRFSFDATRACASASEPSTVIKMRELDALCDLVWDNECHFCPHPEKCNNCKVGQVFDTVLGIDRDKGSWQDVDIRTKEDEKKGK